MADKIRLGIIGANLHRGWAARSHLPAVVASPDFELTAVCTTKQESAEESRQTFGARLAFDDYRKMLAHPDIDAVAVSVRVPSHFEPTMDAINAGKHVFTEWPLGRTTTEALEMARMAQTKGVCNIVGLQARANPGILFAKDLIESGYVGDVMSCHVSLVWDGILQWPSALTWHRHFELGANALSIACGHIIDALCFVVGEFSHVSSVVSTQVKKWVEIESQRMVEVTSPDNILLSGKLANGGVASAYIAGAPWSGSGYRMEIYGREGTLFLSCQRSPTMNPVRIQGIRGGHTMENIEVPKKYAFPAECIPQQAEPCLVGQMYHKFAQSILSGVECQPDFNAAVQLHRFIDTIQEASNTGREAVLKTIKA